MRRIIDLHVQFWAAAESSPSAEAAEVDCDTLGASMARDVESEARGALEIFAAAETFSSSARPRPETLSLLLLGPINQSRKRPTSAHLNADASGDPFGPRESRRSRKKFPELVLCIFGPENGCDGATVVVVGATFGPATRLIEFGASRANSISDEAAAGNRIPG